MVLRYGLTATQASSHGLDGALRRERSECAKLVGDDKKNVGSTCCSTINQVVQKIGERSIVRPGWFWHKSEKPREHVFVLIKQLAMIVQEAYVRD
ncbi:hypothetical protein MKW98_005733 [Papaver atlanticum]|uniref:Uncharacterized protein n=1 Tax=Papaver atlanticum TaxID=357466 RepID=A0AAD4RZ92_9MAGN|nr:hypothetical protein MKW98_005733 [Papaver atlanticum]